MKLLGAHDDLVRPIGHLSQMFFGPAASNGGKQERQQDGCLGWSQHLTVHRRGVQLPTPEASVSCNALLAGVAARSRSIAETNSSTASIQLLTIGVLRDVAQ